MFGVFLTLYVLLLRGVFSADTDGVSVMEGDSVTLHTGVETNQQEKIKWYFNYIRIAQINGELSKICTDVQCNEGNERFRDRLKLDPQTGSLTITNTTNTDSGDYQLQIISSNSLNEKIFNFSVHGVHEVKTISVIEGDSVTLDSGVIRPNDVLTWYFNDILITEITGDQSQICTDDQCKERFRDRLKLDHQTGSLTITNTTNTDSGDYQLQINSSRFSIIRSFSIMCENIFSATVTGTFFRYSPITGIVFVLLVVAAAAAGVFCFHRRRSKPAAQNGIRMYNPIRITTEAELHRRML